MSTVPTLPKNIQTKEVIERQSDIMTLYTMLLSELIILQYITILYKQTIYTNKDRYISVIPTSNLTRSSLFYKRWKEKKI